MPAVNTDIKVTSIKQPQSSCPYKDSKQKIYGLGYNLIVFVYNKYDDKDSESAYLKFEACAFISAEHTGDYQTTTKLREIISNQGNEDDIFAFLCERCIPGDEITLSQMAIEILKNPPKIGYLTISNALQWRLQYKRVIELKEPVQGIENIIRYNNG